MPSEGRASLALLKALSAGVGRGIDLLAAILAVGPTYTEGRTSVHPGHAEACPSTAVLHSAQGKTIVGRFP
jgi:hypothetical protein